MSTGFDSRFSFEVSVGMSDESIQLPLEILPLLSLHY